MSIEPYQLRVLCETKLEDCREEAERAMLIRDKGYAEKVKVLVYPCALKESNTKNTIFYVGLQTHSKLNTSTSYLNPST